MKSLAHLLCICFAIFTFSCETDELFDSQNQDLQLAGEWQVMAIESNRYSSTMISPSGQEDTAVGTFVGSDIDMTLTFNADNSFTTNGDYLQVISIETPLPDPVMVETRFNDFEGGGVWDINGSVLQMQLISESDFNNAILNNFTDSELEFDYSYRRTLTEGNVTRIIDTEITFVLERI